MNLRQLEAFQATIKSGSITGASKILYISQPSVSRLISDLERSVGFPLFLRVGRQVVPTVEARRFYDGVEGMFIGVDRLKELADAIKTTAGGVVSFGVIPAFSQIVMPEAVKDLYHRWPDIRIMAHIRNTPGIVDAVRMQQFDIGIVGRAPPYEGVEVLFETSFPYVCLLPESHDLVVKGKEVDLAAIAESERFITFGGAFPDEMMNMDYKLAEKLRQNSRLSAVNMPVAAALVRETGALAIVDPYTATIAIKLGGVSSLAIQQNLTYSIAIITRGLDTLSLEAKELTKAFIKSLDKTKI
jgi:DNA-binding transcriptional LysR family regulator